MAALEGEVKDLKRTIGGREFDRKVSQSESLKAQKEKERQHLHDQPLLSQRQVETFEGKLKEMEAEVELLHQQLDGKRRELKDAWSKAEEHQETAAIFKQKYTAAIEKVRRTHGQLEHLQEELRYSQQQLQESRSATRSVQEELAETLQRYQEKVSQWENAQEALDQLTDELEANRNLLMESQRKADGLRGQAGTLREQKLTLERELRLCQQSRSHPDEDFLSQQVRRWAPVKLDFTCTQSCAEQVERLTECEKAILQMKSELERQAGLRASLRQSLAASHRAHMSERSQREKEVQRLAQEVAHLKLQLVDAQKHIALLKRSSEGLKEARQDAARRCAGSGARRGEERRLQDEFLKKEEEEEEEEEEVNATVAEKLSLRSHMSTQHPAAVEELAARAEEPRQGKQAEGKIRASVMKLQTEASELRRSLQQASDRRLQAEREKQDATNEMDTLRSNLEEAQADDQNLRFEGKMVMMNVAQWTDQMASKESLSVRTRERNQALLSTTQEKDLETQGRVALNLAKIRDMQLRLRRNLEAIGTLNQRLNALSRENDGLRRQLEEERSMRRPPAPPSCQRCQIRTSIPAGRCDRYPNRAQGAGPESPGEDFRTGFSGAPRLEGAQTGITGGDQSK